MNNTEANLSPLVLTHIERLFPEGEHPIVMQRLHEECGAKLYKQMDWSTLTERVHCAILKISDGKMEKLDQAIEIYQDNWNKVLIEAGFGVDPEAHLKWTAE